MLRIEYVPDNIDDYNTQIKIEVMCPGSHYEMKDYLLLFRSFLLGMSWTMDTIDENIIDPYSSNHIVKGGDCDKD
jgi:hypothetical protein